ncbi:MAG TPA: hypothetical protein VHF69_10645, partial [Candidatus Synoicihabitans sp.]|nr:hypothetical protein [Candidatus Synoicihabitans sp.]
MNARASSALLTALCLGIVSVVSAATSPQDLAALRQRAEAGNPVAQHNLGLVYLNPQEPAHDPVEAYVWFNLAAERGARPQELAGLVERLTPAQVTEAQRRLAARRTSASGGAAPVITPAPLESGEDVATLVADRARLSEELAAAWKEIEQLRAGGTADAELRKRLAIAEHALSNKDRDLQDLRRQLQAQTDDIPPATAKELGDLRAELIRLEEDNRRLVGELGVARTELERVTATTQGSHGQLEAELAEARRAATAAQERALAHVAENRQLLAQVSELTAARDAASKSGDEVAALREQVGRADDARTKAEQALSRAQNSVTQLQNQLSQQTAGAQEAARLRSTLEETQRTLAQREQELEQERASRAAATAAAGQVQTLQSRLAELDAARSRAEQALAETRRTLTERERELAARPRTDHTAELQTLREQLRTAEQARTQAEQSLAQAQTSLTQLQNDARARSTASNEAQRLQAALEESRRALAQREGELTSERAARAEAERRARES